MTRGRKHGAITKSRKVKAKDLKPVLMKMKNVLRVAKVPKVRLPNNDALVSYLNEHLNEFLDWNKLKSWLTDLASTLR